MRICFNPTLVRLRLYPPEGVWVPISGFNPTLVRLRPGAQEDEEAAAIAGFNPTLVRLRPANSSIDDILRFMFQSHAGSIEAQPSPFVIFDLDVRFNPTLVRLRPEILQMENPDDKRFQSHAGSIEAAPRGGPPRRR